MPQPSEDKEIMLQRNTLERAWNISLSAADRAAWLARWAARLPHDAFGREYTPFTRMTTAQTQRPPPTIYAWSQIWATYRVGLPIVLSPSSVPEIDVALSWVSCRQFDLRVRIDSYSPVAPVPPVMLYISGPVSPSVRSIMKQVGYIGFIVGAAAGTVIDVTQNWQVRYDPKPGLECYAHAFALNANNELSNSGALAQATLTI